MDSTLKLSIVRLGKMHFFKKIQGLNVAYLSAKQKYLVKRELRDNFYLRLENILSHLEKDKNISKIDYIFIGFMFLCWKYFN